MQNEKWVLCPVCGNKTRIKIRENTVLLNFLHFTELSGRHSVLERPLSEVNGRLFFS